jgi:hypothetical protein
VASNGTLTYTPAANQNGVANITLHIEDNGGTANGGVDSSATQSFVITVNAVNDPPVALTKTGSAHTNMKIVGVNPGLLTGVTDAARAAALTGEQRPDFVAADPTEAWKLIDGRVDA